MARRKAVRAVATILDGLGSFEMHTRFGRFEGRLRRPPPSLVGGLELHARFTLGREEEPVDVLARVITLAGGRMGALRLPCEPGSTFTLELVLVSRRGQDVPATSLFGPAT